MTDPSCDTCIADCCFAGLGKSRTPFATCANYRSKPKAIIEKKCETCKNKNLSYNILGTGLSVHPCWVCEWNAKRQDNYEPALPEKHDGLNGYEAADAYDQGWDLQAVDANRKFWCRDIDGQRTCIRMCVFKITGRREGK